jgi:hypothetical protein
MLERNVGRLNSVCSVESALGDLGDEWCVGEGQSLEICSILTETDVRLGAVRMLESVQAWEYRHQ